MVYFVAAGDAHPRDKHYPLDANPSGHDSESTGNVEGCMGLETTRRVATDPRIDVDFNHRSGAITSANVA